MFDYNNVQPLLCDHASTETDDILRQFPINYNAQSTLPPISPKNNAFSPNHDQSFNHDTRQDFNTSGNERVDNGVIFGLKTPMEFSSNNTFTSPNNTFSPRNNIDSTFSPRNNINTFSPRNNINTFSPKNNINTFSPRNNNAFSPLNYNNSSTRSNTKPTSAKNHLSNNTDQNNAWDTPSTESLARRQLMAEINETKFLMRDSVTPDAINFWKKHLDELEQRLVALSLEEQLKAVGSGDIQNANKSTLCTQFPDLTPEDRVNSPMNLGRSVRWGCQPTDQNSILADSYNVEITPYTPRNEMPASAVLAPEMPVCDVVAPSDLPGGYMFEAQLDGKKFLATVPPGGVIKGETFTSTMRDLETIEIPVPLGAWRDGAMDCFTDGVFHSLFLNALFVPCSKFMSLYEVVYSHMVVLTLPFLLVALGQIMTRTGLDWRGRPSNRLVTSFSCMNMTVLLMFWIAMNVSASFMMRFAWETGHDIGVDYYGPILLIDIVVLIYMVCLTATVRGSIRNKYQIPEVTCVGAQDCLCATFCMPCTICQMGRHTADYDTYRASCCSRTGLPRHVELAPVTFYDDQYQNMNDASLGHVV